jgi:carbamoyltransferase
MYVLGLSGGPEPTYDHRFFSTTTLHDASSVLVEDGHVVVAVEEERLTRVKHTNKLAVNAIRQCLAARQLRLADLDLLAVYGTEQHYDTMLQRVSSQDPTGRIGGTMRSLLHARFQEDLQEDIDDGRLTFVAHHLAHAVSAYVPSGFARSLVMTIDGVGDNSSGMVYSAEDGCLNEVAALTPAQSMGLFYTRVCQFLGFDYFEEYKVMGLAPYGDASRFKASFSRLYELGERGTYALARTRVLELAELAGLRKRHEPMTQAHRDVAAALQDMLETIVLHVLTHHRKETGHTNLCLAGGVAQNCSMNGRILRSGLFEHVYVQPAAYDAGCALGAALFPFLDRERHTSSSCFTHVYWGSDIGTNETIEVSLRRWDAFLTYEPVSETPLVAAERLAEGTIIAWAQGRAEFGPRALGNRSILADPRPARHKDLINAMVKKREAFRPFAPAVIEEAASQFFELSPCTRRSPYMTCTAIVQPHKRRQLGAVTHVDGTARIQTVSRETNERFWTLIAAFGDLTGVPVVLNTSFNNNAEPIVDSVDDAIVCFLTTALPELFIGDFRVKTKPFKAETLLTLVPTLPMHMQLIGSRRWLTGARLGDVRQLRSNDPRHEPVDVSQDVYEILTHADGTRPLGDLVPAGSDNVDALISELFELWSRRLIWLLPV